VYNLGEKNELIFCLQTFSCTFLNCLFEIFIQIYDDIRTITQYFVIASAACCTVQILENFGRVSSPLQLDVYGEKTFSVVFSPLCPILTFHFKFHNPINS
jgi:hypothetical protein